MTLFVFVFVFVFVCEFTGILCVGFFLLARATFVSASLDLEFSVVCSLPLTELVVY